MYKFDFAAAIAKEISREERKAESLKIIAAPVRVPIFDRTKVGQVKPNTLGARLAVQEQVHQDKMDMLWAHVMKGATNA